MRSPPWHLPFLLFRVADGATSLLLPLVALLRYDLGVAGVAGVVAVFNLASVPGARFWCRLMGRVPARRRITMWGMSLAGAALVALVPVLPLWAYLLSGASFVFFGVAIAPAASVLALEGLPRRDWAAATGGLSRRMSLSYLGGLAVATVVGFLPGAHFELVFLGAAVVAVGAAVVAARRIPPRLPGQGPPPTAMPLSVVRESQRRFERPVWFPSRLTHRPRTAGGPGRGLLWGILLLFAGTVLVTSGLPAVLANDLLLPAGAIILVQAGAPLANATAFSWAGRLGSRGGEGPAIRLGVGMRAGAVVALLAALATAAWLPLGPAVAAVAVANVVLGVSFSLVQVNTPCLLAARHRGGPASGVGAYHGAVGAGVLAGAGGAFLLAGTLGPLAAYAAAVVCLLAGTVLIVRELGRWPTDLHDLRWGQDI